VNLKRKNFALLYESMKRLDLSKSFKFQKYYAEKITPETTYSLKSHHIRAIEKVRFTKGIMREIICCTQCYLKIYRGEYHRKNFNEFYLYFKLMEWSKIFN
jgi:hypothetical protein